MGNGIEADPRALRFLAIITPLFVVGLICFSARIISRVIPSYRLNASDYVNASAVVVIIVAYSLFVTSICKGLGNSVQSFTHESVVEVLRLTFFVRLFGTGGATLARLSISLQLLPFSRSRQWKAGLWGIAALEVASLVTLIFYTFLQIQPITKNWDGSGYTGRTTVMYAFLAAAVLGDLWCSIMPWFLIWDLSRSKLERYFLSILIGLGLCAAAAATTILVLLIRLQNSHDALRDSILIYTWCLVEQSTLIVASCAPLLKSLVERALRRLGFAGFHNIPRELGDYPSNDFSQKSRWHVTRMWHGRYGSASQSQDNTVVTQGSRLDPNVARTYKADSSNSNFDPFSTKTAVSIQTEGRGEAAVSLRAMDPG
ncbi:hypothetical protein BKA64DRAFT_634910 [Cadophora sp. MPI-SDFR-AT-0126]|nr:hypothetical protein BKA64DRAFT_634910 [Leotiomycetes sp. MPI-SDFR-AT-0126]